MTGPPVSLLFYGEGLADGSIRYDVPAKARRTLVAKRFAGQPVEVEIRAFRDKRSERQNRGFHVMVQPWAREKGWAIETLKQVVLREVFGVLEVPHPVTGEVLHVLAEPHTSTLTVGQFSDLIERTLELAAEDGLMLQAPDEYTKQQKKRAKR